MTIEQISLLSLFVSLLAFIVSAISIYLQNMVEGPKIELLNAEDVQFKVPRYHKELPEEIQKTYPHVPDAASGYALVKLVFGNSGDRAGTANINDIKIRNNLDPAIKISAFSYALIPAYAIIEKEILLRNIEIGEYPKTPIEIALRIEYGGYHPRTGKALRKETIEKTLHVLLIQGDEKPTMQIF